MRISRVLITNTLCAGIGVMLAGCSESTPPGLERLSPGQTVYGFTDKKANGIVGGYFPELDQKGEYWKILQADFDPQALPHIKDGDKLVVVKDDWAIDFAGYDGRPWERMVDCKVLTGQLAGMTGQVFRKQLTLRGAPR